MARRLAVDFDKTLVTEDYEGNFYPVEGAREALSAFRAQGFQIIVYSCRTGIADQQGSLNSEVQLMESLLQGFDMEYDQIYLGEKLIADAYIDDRAVEFRGNWEQAAQSLERLFQMEAQERAEAVEDESDY